MKMGTPRKQSSPFQRRPVPQQNRPPSFQRPYNPRNRTSSPSRSPGSALGAIAGIIIIMAFFLPWVRACGTELTGYDIATNSNGMVEEAWQYWLVPASGLILIILFAFLRTRTFGMKVSLGVARIIIGLLGFLPVLNVWRNVQDSGGVMEVLYGGWILVSGFALIFLSFIVDLFPIGDN